MKFQKYFTFLIFFHSVFYLQTFNQTFADPINPSNYANKWLVIAGGWKFGESGSIPEKFYIENLTGTPAVLSSSDFANLNPGFTIIVANAFTDQQNAKQYSGKLKNLGIDNYIKLSGKYIGKGDGKQTIRWIEHYNGRTFMAIGLDSISQTRIKPKPSKPSPITLSEWVEPLDKDSIGGTVKGEIFTLYSLDGENERQCSIKQYVWLTRGVPHFGYIQNAEEEKPSEPGCGSPVLFAELDCSDTGKADFALPGNPLTLNSFYTLKKNVQNESLVTYIKKQSQYLKIMSKAQKEATEKNETLQISFLLNNYVFLHYSIYTISIHMITGEGNNECGGTDLNIQINGIFREDTSKNLTTLFPLEESENDVTAITDIDNDGKIEVFENGFYNLRQVRLEENPSRPFYIIEIDFCDCGC